MTNEQENEPGAFVVSQGRLADFILRLSRPVCAWPGQVVVQVVLHGHGVLHHRKQ